MGERLFSHSWWGLRPAQPLQSDRAVLMNIKHVLTLWISNALPGDRHRDSHTHVYRDGHKGGADDSIVCGLREMEMARSSIMKGMNESTTEDAANGTLR